jgi:hypothetical protein
MGVLMVASREITAQRMVQPELSVDWWDLIRARELAAMVLDMTDDVYLEYAEAGMERVRWFGPKVQQKRLMRALDGKPTDEGELDSGIGPRTEGA